LTAASSPCPSLPWGPGWREAAWAGLNRPWDLIIIGGGITGAGILNLAARCGLKVLLLEQNDFASGTSSRSSKLVHGGLRYLKQLHLRLTYECVRERQYLLNSIPGLVEPLDFTYPLYAPGGTRPWLMKLGLSLYTHLSPQAGTYATLEPAEIGRQFSDLARMGMIKGYRFGDAATDDARLVLRVLSDGLRAAKGNALALNYAHVDGFLRMGGKMAGAAVADRDSERKGEAFAPVVINAGGAWADAIRAELGLAARLRPLRGSHLFFQQQRLPIPTALMLEHPRDGRPLFLLPWEGVTLVGTTDVDHPFDADEEPFISGEEQTYLLEALHARFPELHLAQDDLLAVQAGVRPVVRHGKKDPSQESREHILWDEKGLLTVAGGKLTTFRLIALEALRSARALSGRIPRASAALPVVEEADPACLPNGLDPLLARRLCGRYGSAADMLLRDHPDLRDPVPGTATVWAELAWAARHEAVEHLDDLLLRRTRLGLILGEGVNALLPRIKEICAPVLGWNEERWLREVERFQIARRASWGRMGGSSISRGTGSAS